MRSVKLSAVILALVVGACAEDDAAQGSGNLLAEGDQDVANDESADPTGVASAPADAGDFLERCVNGGGSVGMIEVVFDCDSITVYSCKDISNVVIEFADGERQRVEGGGLGQAQTFTSTDGGQVAGVWVKAGSNHSGDGPGYGERFDAPAEQDCDPPDEGGGGSGGTGGTCGSNDPDEVCAGTGGGGEGGSGDEGDSGGTGGSCGSNDPDAVCAGAGGASGENGGQPVCEEGDPRCTVM